MAQVLETASQVEVLETMERLSRAGFQQVDGPRRLRPGEYRRVVGWSEAERRVRFTLEWELGDRSAGQEPKELPFPPR